MPEVVDNTEPPNKVKIIKYRPKFSGTALVLIPEVPMLLRILINTENKSTPLTDEQLSSLLGGEEYHIARRTVAKYREGLNIPIAKLRREL